MSKGSNHPRRFPTYASLIRPKGSQSPPFRWIPVSSESLRNILDMKLQHVPASFLGMSWKKFAASQMQSDPHGNLWDPQIKSIYHLIKMSSQMI